MIVVFFILVVFFIAVGMFMFHELFVKKNAPDQPKMVVMIDQWDEDLIEAFIRHVKKFNRYIEVRIIVKGKPQSTGLENLLREKYDILWTEG